MVEYINGYEYKNNQLKYIATSGGFIKFENNQYHYVYQYKDQVGNVMLTYQDINKNGFVENTEILNESNYYPFGLKHGHYSQLANNFINSLLPNQSFNGQPSLVDLETNLTLMDFRLYDNALGRFTGIDLLADMFTDHSPYHFAYNNPISFMDPTGLASGTGGDSSLLDEIIVIANPIPVAPDPGLPPFGSVPAIIRAIEDLARLFDPNSPIPDTELPELVIDKPKEAKNTQVDEFVWGTGTAITIVQFGADRATKEYAKEISKTSAQKALQSAKVAKVATKVGVGVSLGYGLYTYGTSERKNSDTARLVGSVVITASNFIPYVGPVISIGLGLLDAHGYFDSFYNGFD